MGQREVTEVSTQVVFRRGAGPRRTGALIAAAIVALLASLPGSVLADDPTVAWDGVMTVGVTYPADAGGGPIEGAVVDVEVRLVGEPFFFVIGTTGIDGLATFDTFPYPIGDGVDLAIDIVATYFPDPPAPGTCGEAEGYVGAIGGLVAAATLELTIEATPTWREVCTPDDGLPDGVLADGELVVTVRHDDGDPFVGALVGVIASLSGDKGGLAKIQAPTDENGDATLTGLPRPDVGGPDVTWLIDASPRRVTMVDGCESIRTWYGSAEVAAAAGTSSVQITLTENVPQWGACEAPPDGSPILVGWILDEDGLPFAVEAASILQMRPGGGGWFAPLSVDADGRFEAPVHAWGTVEEPSGVQISARSPVIGEVRDGDCVSVLALIADQGFSLALSVGAPELPTIVAHPVQVQQWCDTDEGPGESAPPVPATDASDPGPTSDGSAPPDPVIWTVVLGTLLVMVVVRRTPARRSRADPR